MECISQVLNEAQEGRKPIPLSKRIGDYNVIEGQWWDGWPHGLEDFDAVQDVRMYDRNGLKGGIETIGLFKQISSGKFFYAKIIPIKNSKETKWKPIHKEEIPKIILDDLRTINPHTREPYLS